MNKLYGMILAGGSGTRLWPWSREELPKQFLSLTGNHSLLQNTVIRVSDIVSPENLSIVTGRQWDTLVRHQSDEVLSGENFCMATEPCPRNTCPAIALGIATLMENCMDDDDYILVCPSDHIIKNPEAFKCAVERGKAAAQEGYLVTFGVPPVRPETGFGYLKTGSKNSNGFLILDSFVEKPNEEKATQYVKAGNYFWNSGIFLFRISDILQAMKKHTPELYSALSQGRDALTSSFGELSKISIDYAIMEKASKIAMVPLDAGWSDVGSWDALYDIMEKDVDDNVILSDGRITNGSGNLVMGDNRLIAGMDIDDLVIVDSPDALFIGKRGQSQHVRQVVDALKMEERKEAIEAPQSARPWGTYRTLDHGDRYKIKHIVVQPGKRLSLQYHHHRSEHWIVVRGTALVTVNDKEIYLHEGESSFISKNDLHRLGNPGKIPLEIIEVQNGEYLGEDDIVRIEDDYKRDND